MKGLKKLVGSRRFWVALFAFVAILVSELGLNLSPELLDSVQELVLYLVVGYSAQDMVVAFKK